MESQLGYRRWASPTVVLPPPTHTHTHTYTYIHTQTPDICLGEGVAGFGGQVATVQCFQLVCHFMQCLTTGDTSSHRLGTVHSCISMFIPHSAMFVPNFMQKVRSSAKNICSQERLQNNQIIRAVVEMGY
jgi:hypothetical protein